MDVSAGDRDRADRLRTAELEVIGRFAAASNATLLCRLCDDATDLFDGGDGTGVAPPVGLDLDDVDPAHLCIYKPRRGEAPLWDFPEGTLYRREIAAFEVDRLLGWSMVPLTVLREDGPFGVGAVQQYVAHDPGQHYFWMLEQGPPALVPQLQRMVLFDLVVDNADRKGSHVLLDDGGRVRLVDHGVSFHVQRKLRTVAWEFAGEAVPGGLREDVGRLHDVLAAAGDDTVALRSLLTPPEVDRLIARSRTVADLAAFPRPQGSRPFPWPPL